MVGYDSAKGRFSSNDITFVKKKAADPPPSPSRTDNETELESLEEEAVHESLINASLWETRARTVGASEIIAEIRDVSEERGDVPLDESTM